ncbi:MAG: acyltransferase family protein, partial [Huintestinicola sp.]
MDLSTKRYYNIDALRFLFSVFIVYFHLLRSNIIPYTGEQELYAKLSQKVPSGGLIVDCFLILGGFFLYVSFSKKQTSFIEFFINKVIRVWPVLAFSAIVSVFVYGFDLQNFMMDTLLLKSIGIFNQNKGIIWFIAPYFWGCIIVYAILYCFNKRTATFLIGLTAYLGYAINLNTIGTFGRDVELAFVSLALLRALAGISTGAIIAIGLDAFHDKFGEDTNKPSVVQTVIVSIIEIGLFGLLVACIGLNYVRFKNPFCVIIIFSLLVIAMINGNGILSRLTNHKLFAYLGRYSYSIYVMQQLSFFFLGKTFWTNSAFLYDHAILSCLISVIISVVCGIIVYHCVE